MLRDEDLAAVEQLGLAYEVAKEADGFLSLVLHAMRMPIGLQPETADVLVRLPPGFPDAAPDMFWCEPAVVRTNGTTIQGTEARGTYVGRTWQRWSRHIGGNWRPGIDNLSTYMAYVRRCLHQAAEQAA